MSHDEALKEAELFIRRSGVRLNGHEPDDHTVRIEAEKIVKALPRKLMERSKVAA